MIRENYLDEMVKEFKIKLESTECIKKNGGRVFELKKKEFANTYLLDDENIRRIVCYPHVVGKELEDLCLKIAKNHINTILESIELKGREVVVEHVLMASLGYRLHEVLKKKFKIREVAIRPRFARVSYKIPPIRKMSMYFKGFTSIPAFYKTQEIKDKVLELRKNLSRPKEEILFEDFSALPKNSEIVVFKPDVEATGKSSEISLRRLVEKAEEINSKIETLVLYGFISRPALLHVKKIAKLLGIEEFRAFTFAGLSELAHNGYNMIIYGLDESYFREFSKKKRVGGVINIEILEDYLEHYIPGSDHVCDFSDRQEKLFNGLNWEKSHIKRHLSDTIKLIKNVREISQGEWWYRDFHERMIKEELDSLMKTFFQYY